MHSPIILGLGYIRFMIILQEMDHSEVNEILKNDICKMTQNHIIHLYLNWMYFCETSKSPPFVC